MTAVQQLNQQLLETKRHNRKMEELEKYKTNVKAATDIFTSTQQAGARLGSSALKLL